MARQVLLLDSGEKVALLRSDIRPGLGRKYRGLKLALPELSSEDNAALEKKLGRLYGACGCAEGAVGSVVGVVGFAVWALLRETPLEWVDLAYLAGAFLVASGIGKLYGLWRSHLRLRAEVEQLAARYGVDVKRLPPDPNGPSCAVN